MSEIWAGMAEAFLLVWSLDADLIDITLRSLKVSLSALVVASAVALPLGTWLAVRRFRHRRLADRVLFLNKGQVEEQRVADTFFTAPKSSGTISFLNGDIIE